MNPDCVSAPTLEAPAAPRPAVSPQAPTARGPWWRVFARKRFLFISLGLHLLLALGATVWIVQVVLPNRTKAFTPAQPPAAKAATHALEHQVKLAKKQASMSAPPALKRVTTKAMAVKVALPALPTMPVTQKLTPLAISGTGVMPGAGFGFGSGAGGGGGLGGGGGGGATNFIGGLRITAQRLGVALDTSGSVADYQAEMHDYVGKVFKGSEVLEFHVTGFFGLKTRYPSLGMVMLELLNSPKHFDAIYVFSDFGETYAGARKPDQPDLWPEVQKLIREKKVKLYLHLLPFKSGNTQDSPEMMNTIALAKSSGGGVKMGDMPHASLKADGSVNAAKP